MSNQIGLSGLANLSLTGMMMDESVADSLQIYQIEGSILGSSIISIIKHCH